MKYAVSLLVMFLLGCYCCEKKPLFRTDSNNLIREDRKRIIEERVIVLSDWEKNEVKKAYLSMRFALNLSDKKYKDKVLSLKNKYSTEENVLRSITELDMQVSSELMLGRRIEARHLIHNALEALDN